MEFIMSDSRMMLARNYDSELGRFYSVDPLSNKFPSLSSYNYTMNNPIYYKDPDGEFAISFLTGFFRSLYNGNSLGTSVTDGWNSVKNEASILSSFFRGNARQVASKFTWELPQQLLGVSAGIVNNWLGNVKSISHNFGATMIETKKESWGGITIGSIIHIEKNRTFFDPLAQHEYGHYLQSQDVGWVYLFKYGLPSLYSVMTSTYDEHKLYWTETDADARSNLFFNSQNSSPIHPTVNPIVPKVGNVGLIVPAINKKGHFIDDIKRIDRRIY
jgi:hypothetical protein